MSTERGEDQCPGREDLETLRLDQAERVMKRRCDRCRRQRDVSRLLMGFDSPHAEVVERLDTLLERFEALDAKLGARFDELIFDTWRSKELSAEQFRKLAHLYRTVIQALTTERRDGPCLFSLLPEGRTLTSEKQRLTLWCKWPDAPHPCVPIFSGNSGDYQIKQPREWLAQWSPAISWMVRVLKVAAPIAGAFGREIADTLGLKDVKADIGLMEKLVGALPSGELEVGSRKRPKMGLARRPDGEGPADVP